MAAPTVIKSTDDDTPIMNGVIGQAIVFFDEILVNRLGWTKEFSGTNKAVYRPASGLRLFYRINDAGGFLGAKFTIQTYESMSDVDTGSGAGQVVYYYKSGDATTTARAWIVIGDSAGLHLIIKPMPWGWDRWEWNYFGDFIPMFSTDAWISIVTGMGFNSTNPNNNILLLASNATVQSVSNSAYQGYLARRLSGDVSTIGASVQIVGCGCLASPGGVFGTVGPAYPTDGKLIYTQPRLSDGAVNTYRGFIPGLYNPEHASGLTHGEVYVDGDRQLMAITTVMSNSSIGNILIDVGGGFRP